MDRSIRSIRANIGWELGLEFDANPIISCGGNKKGSFWILINFSSRTTSKFQVEVKKEKKVVANLMICWINLSKSILESKTNLRYSRRQMHMSRLQKRFNETSLKCYTKKRIRYFEYQLKRWSLIQGMQMFLLMRHRKINTLNEALRR